MDDDHDGVDDRLVFLTRILALAKLADDDFSPTHIFWLTRAQRYFPERAVRQAGVGSTKEDRALTVAFNFKRFSSVAIFSRREIFK